MRSIKKVIILLIIAIIGIIIYMSYGLKSSNIGYFIPLRGTKIIAILVVSYCIGYSSVVFQTITGNKILTPSVMGLDSLYLFVQTLVVFFFQSRNLTLLGGNTNFIISVLVMVLFSMLLYMMLFKGEQKNIYSLLLAGMICGTLFGGMANFMQVLLDPNEFAVLQGKMFASFSNVNESLIIVSIIICVICFMLTIKDLKTLDVLSIGADNAINLGVNYKRIIQKNLAIVAILIAVSTALVGPITFLGILVVSLARQVTKTYKHNYLIIASSLIGIIFLVYGLFIIEQLLKLETTLSVIINFIGGVYFIYFIIKEGKK